MLVIKRCLKHFIMFLYYHTHKVRNKAVFESFSGSSYSDNPRAISEKLHEMAPDVEIVWLFTKPDTKREIVPEYVRVEQRCTKNMIRELSTAKIWVNNFCMHDFIYKGKRNTYIQTWHGDRPFKKVIYESNKLHFKDGEVRENEICDLCVAGSDIGVHVYHEAFRYHGEILCVGSPRADVLINGDRMRCFATKEKLGIPCDTKVVMYAPTFRDNKGLNASQSLDVLDFDNLIETLENVKSEKWVCVIRVHPSLRIKDISALGNKVVNASAYEDMSDLMLIADMLITDYSSSAGDFVLQNKPVFLYQYDLDEYEKEDRELHFKMCDSPFWSVRTQNELLDGIRAMTEEGICKNCADILKFYGTKETGRASEEVCKYAIKRIKGER